MKITSRNEAELGAFLLPESTASHLSNGRPIGMRQRRDFGVTLFALTAVITFIAKAAHRAAVQCRGLHRRLSAPKCGRRLLYEEPTCGQFIADMVAAGYTVEHYYASSGWQGPSIRIANDRGALRQAVAASLSSELRADIIGRELLLRPARSGRPLWFR